MGTEKCNSGWRIYEKHQAADLSFFREREKQNILSDSWLWTSKTIMSSLGQKSENNAVFVVQSLASPRTNDDGWSLGVETYALCSSPESFSFLGAFLDHTVSLAGTTAISLWILTHVLKTIDIENVCYFVHVFNPVINVCWANVHAIHMPG